MQELVQHLCRIIADRLQAQPQIPTADLVTAVLAQIAGDDRLQKLLDDSKARIVQNNSGDASGYQVRVEGGVVYVGNEKIFNISGDNVAGDKVSGDKYVYNFNLILKSLGLVPVGIPHNIKLYGSKHFVGRDEKLHELDRLLQSSRQVAVTAVQGMGGVGKTELALQYALAQLRAETHPGGVCWLRGREDVGGQIEIFAQTQLGIVVPEELKNRDLSERVAYYWRRWREGEVLVVVDDVLDYEGIAGYLPPVETRFKVLLTTRLELGSGIQRLPLGVLAPPAALQLLRGLIGGGRVDGELADAESLCEWLGYLPLGIELVGRYLARNRTLTLTKMQERLNEKRLAARGLIKHDVAMTATHVSLAAAFEVSWEDLGNEVVFAAPAGEYARQLGALLSLFAVAPIVWEWVVACVPEWDEEDLEAARDEGLMGSHLLQVNGDNTYQLHPLVREFLEVKCDEMSIKNGLLECFKEVILTESKKSIQHPEKSLIVECELIIPHLKGLIDQIEISSTEVALSSLFGLYYAMGRYSEAEIFALQSLSINERLFGENNCRTAQSMNNLAEFYSKTGIYNKAEKLFIKAIDIYYEQDEADLFTVKCLIVCLNNFAFLYYTLGQYVDAKLLYNESLSIAEQQLAEYPIYKAFSLIGLANVSDLTGEHEAAEKLYLECLAIRKEILGIYHLDTAESLNNLANLYESTSRYEEAEILYDEALEIRANKLGADHPDTAQSLNNLAYLYMMTNRYTESAKLYNVSLEVRENILGADHLDTAESLNNLAGLYMMTNRYSEAKPLFERSLAIREKKLGTDHDTTQNTRANLEINMSFINIQK
jgi:tetratricopeptide (TPR) repeat protein